MKRIWSVIFSVLLGALMVGLGTGYFLHLANKDRQALAEQVDKAKTEMQTVKDQSQKAIQAANDKLHLASQEVDKAHQTLQALEQERALIAKAQILHRPDPKNIKDWKTIISSSFGISISYPPTAFILQDSDKELSLGIIPSNSIIQVFASNTKPWLDIQPYSSNLENIYLSQITSTEEASFFISGRLLNGHYGKLINATSSEAYLLRIYNNGTSTHMIWLQTPETSSKTNIKRTPTMILKDILATIDFK